MNRRNEHGGTPDRKTRFTHEQSYWYYNTREGFHIGPFDSKHEAEEGARSFIDFVLHAEPEVLKALERYQTAA